MCNQLTNVAHIILILPCPSSYSSVILGNIPIFISISADNVPCQYFGMTDAKFFCGLICYQNCFEAIAQICCLQNSRLSHNICYPCIPPICSRVLPLGLSSLNKLWQTCLKNCDLVKWNRVHIPGPVLEILNLILHCVPRCTFYRYCFNFLRLHFSLLC